ncbi:cytochrome b [Methylococcus geothermalis]|uniref:Cytochrome b n=1 Tax=Methylococcus geothermalis TaxID=2681310 RepID=A0A858Q8H4_9GAMM|nr:cytochrome b [Methylococcus geothermalis]QJD30064.1 cytochrome b [Methylococcus geothermalis]
MNATRDEYTNTAKWLHWIMAVLIVLAWFIGLYVADLPKGPEKALIMAWHKGFGTAVLALITVRLAWRLLNPPPQFPDGMSPGLRQAAHSVHWTLYGLMIAQPLSGWAVSSASGYPVKLIGLITLPALVEKNESLAEFFVDVHSMLGWGLAILVLGHVAMAIKHHHVDRNGILKRILPGHRPAAD